MQEYIAENAQGTLKHSVNTNIYLI